MKSDTAFIMLINIQEKVEESGRKFIRLRDFCGWAGEDKEIKEK
jgi:hypothetical protein